MKFLAYLVVLTAFYRVLSYAKYNWDNGNKTAAAGALFMGLLALILPTAAWFILG